MTRGELERVGTQAYFEHMANLQTVKMVKNLNIRFERQSLAGLAGVMLVNALNMQGCVFTSGSNTLTVEWTIFCSVLIPEQC